MEDENGIWFEDKTEKEETSEKDNSIDANSIIMLLCVLFYEKVVKAVKDIF